ncbi:MAG TPA: helix-turn-helix domain-containing protein [Kiritimatiellia bacterium]|nr:helix-turn-helix domain-containing protein [Kiritimatiellia bacterium]HPS06377.1 helix-turn-helix domain-containing protein [Kiritimatiellia bacterium]
MAQLSIAFCRQLSKARREKGMTQSALAEAVGCKQSAISMLESGQSVKIARETVEKIASRLGVPLEPASDDPRSPAMAAGPLPAHAFCPNAFCYTNVPYVVNGDLLFWPRPQPASAAGGTHCAVCGELLERRCPHCGAPLGAGACCPHCGGALVTNTLPPETDPETWSAQRRREIAEWRSLTL